MCRKWNPTGADQMSNQLVPKSNPILPAVFSRQILPRLLSKEYSTGGEQRRGHRRSGHPPARQGSGNSCAFLNILLSMRPAILALTWRAITYGRRIREIAVDRLVARSVTASEPMRNVQLTLMGGPAKVTGVWLISVDLPRPAGTLAR